MAYIGLRKPIIGKRTGAKKYENPFALGKAVSLQVTPNYAEGSLYGDDIQAEYDKEFNYAEITMGTTTIPIKAHAAMFGHEVEEAEKSIEMNANDENEYVGMAWITVEKVDGVKCFTGNFLYKVKCSEPSEDYTTKGESIEYKTPSITGRALAEDDGAWKKVKAFDTEEKAIEWINTMFGTESEETQSVQKASAQQATSTSAEGTALQEQKNKRLILKGAQYALRRYELHQLIGRRASDPVRSAGIGKDSGQVRGCIRI